MKDRLSQPAWAYNRNFVHAGCRISSFRHGARVGMVTVMASERESNQASDAALLRAFVASGSEEAFAALVEKYLGMVLGIAARRTGDHALAEEIAQNVFAVLARKARALIHAGRLDSSPSAANSGVDATKKLPGERFKRPWPPLIRMDAAVKAKMEKLFNP